jgi:hypothetical protein
MIWKLNTPVIRGTHFASELDMKKPWQRICAQRAMNGFCQCTGVDTDGLTASKKSKLRFSLDTYFADSTY